MKTGRIIAIDYGTKRCGIAVSDSLQIIATPLTVVPAEKLIPFLVEYCKTETVSCLVIGLPLNLRNEEMPLGQNIATFIEKFQKQLPDLTIHRLDERFTSKMAQASMLQSGMKKKERAKKENIDLVSAVILLQGFMEIKNTHPNFKL